MEPGDPRDQDTVSGAGEVSQREGGQRDTESQSPVRDRQLRRLSVEDRRD